MLVIGNLVCVLDIEEYRKQIMEEAYTAPYVMHPGSTKMYWGFESLLLVANNKERCGGVCS